MRWLWQGLSYVAWLVTLPLWLFHPKLRAGKAQRLGFRYPSWPPAAAATRPLRIWAHGASAGDILALLPTLACLKAQRPGCQILLTAFTRSGYDVACRHRQQVDACCYAPLDLPHAVRRCLGHFQPDVLLLEYAEMWPQLLLAASAAQVRIVLHNGRLRSKSLRGYRLLDRVVGGLMARFSLLLMRSAEDAAVARALGAQPAQLRIGGNTKFDAIAVPPSAALAREILACSGFPAGSRCWVVGSLHRGEEEVVFAAFGQLRACFPDLRLLLAPRYPEHGPALARSLIKQGYRVALRSSKAPPPSATAARDAGTDVFILDSVGELRAAYTLADVVMVGGSFVRRGGQNILEPAALGKPVLFGPHMENFADACAWLAGHGVMQVADAAALQAALHELLGDAAARSAAGAKAHARLQNAGGCAARNAAYILALAAMPDPLPHHPAPTH